jgi:hypothetical protein
MTPREIPKVLLDPQEGEEEEAELHEVILAEEDWLEPEQPRDCLAP